jgi:hypothetical protein
MRAITIREAWRVRAAPLPRFCLLFPILVVDPVAAQQSRPAESELADGPWIQVCELRDPRITECSGIAASRCTPGLYYVHNDSGDEPRVFLIDRQGHTRATIRPKGAKSVDWEDVAIAPGARPDTFDVCVADIGDNGARRSDLTIYRFAEVAPTAVTTQPAAAETIEVEPTVYRIRYADGPSDAEAFAVHPITGDAYIITRTPGPSCRVYKLASPWNAEAVTTLPRIAEIRWKPDRPILPLVTAADISPDGRRLAVRDYLGGFEWRLPDDKPGAAFDEIFKTEPTPLRLPPEPQSEGICYSLDGRRVLTVSERRPTFVFETSLDSARQP